MSEYLKFQTIQASDKDDRELEGDSGTQTLVRPEGDTKEPPLFKVVILNDDFTPREFVVHVLKKFFRKNDTEATQLMMEVHNKGAGIAGVFPHEIAETKAYQLNSYARANQYPLKSVTEEA